MAAFKDEKQCPVTGRKLRHEMLNGRWQPVERYNSSANPAGLNDRIRAAGYNPDAFMAFDGAVPVLAYLIVNGERVASIEPSRDRGRFGGCQVVPAEGQGEKMFMGRRWDMPDAYDIEWVI